jgi:putative peptidoglycan lipid II flippase
LNARGRFVAAALAPAVNNVVVVAACIAFRATREGDGVVGLHLTTWQFLLVAGGTTLGVVAFSLTPALALNSVGVSWFPSWNPHHPAVRTLRGSFGWMTLSIVSTLVPTTAALALGNGAEGGVAVFMYAFAFFVLPHALIAFTLATTLGPRVAEGWQAGRVREVRSAIDSAMKAAVPLLTLAAAGMVALAWPLTRLVANVGQTASQGQAPIAHTLAAFGPGLIGYGIAFVVLRVLFVLGEVRTASLLMVVSAAVGVVVMVVLSMTMAPGDRAAALAIGYGSSQVVGAVLLSVRLHRLTRAMSLSRSAGLLLEALLAGAAAAGAMYLVEAVLAPTDPSPVLGFFLGGVAGVAAFTVVMTLARGRDLWGWVRR